MFNFGTTAIPGLRRVAPRLQRDDRGSFVKLFHEESFADNDLGTGFAELYVSTSYRGVIRGLHFQLPPNDHDKLVYCLTGSVLDVVVDLRVNSPTFRQLATFQLDEADAAGLYIPKGCAHGFLVCSEIATMLYMVETMFAPSSDSGVRWDSIGFDWPVTAPIISTRDQLLPSLDEFVSPF